VRLAEAGWSVCLVEANQDIGGSARTLECILPGFRHDLGAGFLALAMVSPATAGRDLARFGLRFCHAPLPAAHPLPGGRAIALGRSTMQTAASIGRIHAADAAVWEQLDGTSAMGSSGWCTPGWSAGPEPPRCGRVMVGAEHREPSGPGLSVVGRPQRGTSRSRRVRSPLQELVGQPAQGRRSRRRPRRR
jgi:hypothetical protein